MAGRHRLPDALRRWRRIPGGAAALPALPGYPLQVSTLAVVGAGPKGIAIAAKARALAAAGLPAPRVVLVDRGEVAGNWSGRQGYTSGLLPLGTPPEKDVGYPYAASWGGASADVVAAMAEYSWQRHLIRHDAYGDWVDRGRIRPTHRQWSAYLRDVADAADAEIARGVVTGARAAPRARAEPLRHRQWGDCRLGGHRSGEAMP
jgi:cation diffusion facilitator CzcD-associated flavoprotein CzcO